MVVPRHRRRPACLPPPAIVPGGLESVAGDRPPARDGDHVTTAAAARRGFRPAGFPGTGSPSVE